ncbi:MAG TPA: hypothetical protein VJL58_10175 [Pyrinomonadaceae bacterium]|nr:hypothetical protein [Pyrinomonadaceae bacterium]
MTLIAPTIIEKVAKNWRYIVAAVVVLVVIGLIIFARSCYTDYQWNKTDGELNQLEGNTANAQVDTWAAEQNKRDAEAEANKAAQDVQAARDEANAARNNTRPATVDEANRNRCIAYPERCK